MSQIAYSHFVSEFVEDDRLVALFVAVRDNRVIASCTVDSFKPKSLPCITAFFVDPNCRRQGIGTELLNYVMKVCSQNHIGGMWLYVSKKNISAQRLYQKAGFTPMHETSIDLGLGIRLLPWEIKEVA